MKSGRSRYSAIHFDMDGVIADTEAFHVAAEKQTCLDYGFAIDTSQWGGFKGRTAVDIFTHLIDRYGDPRVHKPDELIAHKTDVFIASLSGRLMAIDGVVEFLGWAREAHKNVSLVTSSNTRVQRFIIESLNLEGIFDAIVTGDEVVQGKPAPEPYVRALGKLGIDNPRESIVVEDSLSGIQSGLGAGCDVLAVTNSHSRSVLECALPTYIAEDYVLGRSLLEIPAA